MSDKEGDLEENSLLFDSNCETSDNISIGSSNGAISMVQENQSYATKKIEILKVSGEKVKCEYKFLHDGSTRNMSSYFQDKHNLYENKNKIQSNICSDDALNSSDSDSSVNVANSEKPILRNIAEIKTSGSYYTTLSIIYSLIEALKFIFAKFEISSNTPNNEQESSDDNSDDSENNTSDLTNDSFQNTHLIKSMWHIIYNSLFDYWNKPLMVGLLATLLDPQLKTLFSWDQKTQKKAKAELARQFKDIATSNYEQTTSIYTISSNSNNIRCNHLHSLIFGTSTSTDTTSNPC
ncbi:26038_t:CDS:2 [Dentiscutata erythropus]|uniref:26038_t:CDS:1 n=1 Tax=Dentiscutata erythropus TaxID=1348616 RepID=A0A9N9BK63_9GLOM|nr:26038_t:CDS:2 [Dentiscutata erythropus]